MSAEEEKQEAGQEKGPYRYAGIDDPCQPRSASALVVSFQDLHCSSIQSIISSDSICRKWRSSLR